MKTIELYDNGHGIDTAGKCSPDKSLREFRKARDLVKDIVAKRCTMGYDARILVPEEKDISLAERVRRANNICIQNPGATVILISVHCNAAGADGKWKSAGGWCAYTSPGKTKADDLATCLYDAAAVALKDYITDFPIRIKRLEYDSKQHPIRTDYSDGDPDYEARFYILMKTKCPAVLTESMFQDNKADVDFLLSKEGHEAIVKLHVDGVDKYLKSISK